MENIKCVICSSSDSEFYRKVESESPKQASFNLVKCKGCGLIYLNPRPDKEEIHEFYPHWSSVSKQNVPISLDWKAKKNNFNLLKRHLKKKGSKVLDVGSGSGEFLSLMQRAGWGVSGVEYAQNTSNFARDNLGLNVLNKDLLETNFEDGYFDLVTLWDSLEHLHKAGETLLEINRILKKDGILVISCPNIDNLCVLLFKDSWYTNSPRHLYQFSSEGIKSFLAKTNFKPFKILYKAGYFEPIGFVVTFKNWLLAKSRRTFKAAVKSKGNSQARASLSLLFKDCMRLILELIFLPLSLLSVFIKKAPNIVVFAKKC